MGMSSCVSPGARPRNPCRCTGCPRATPPDPLDRPHKSSKMKMLKKIKRKMGLGRSSCVGGSNAGPTGGLGLPPITFHSCHGENVGISRDGSHARRLNSFCKGIVFSSRPIAINEKICIKFTEMSTNWSGVLRFGFTSHDPTTLKGVLPKYACPDLTNKPGHWAKALAERFCDRGSLLQYYVTSSGDVHFSVDGDDKGIFFTGVETKGPLWALLDVYGNCTGIQLIDSRGHLNNARRDEVESTSIGSVHNVDDDEIDRSLVPALRAANIGDGWRPAMLHRTCGKYVRIEPELGIATRSQTEFCQGYVFTARPLAPGERLMIKILDTDPAYTGALALGLTSCDPSRLTSRDLPDDSDMLLDRPEYWVVSKDVAGTPCVGEELVLSVSGVGEVKVSRNGMAPVTVMYVDYTLRLWAFLDVYGSTKRVQVFTRPPPAVLVVALPPPHNVPNHLVAPTQSSHLQSTQSFSSSSSSTTSLPVSLNAPISSPSISNHRNALHQSTVPIPNGSQHQQVIPRASSANLLSHIPLSNTVPAQVIQLPSSNVVVVSQGHPTPVVQQNPTGMIHHQIPTSSNSGNGVVGECTICYEQPIDSVLYSCGHMCMCYRCAVQQWRGKGGGQCPMCRASIKDVIRTYKP